MGHDVRKTCLQGFRQSEIQTSLLSYGDRLENWNFALNKFRYNISNKGITKALTRLRRYAGWSAPLLFSNYQRQVFSRHGPYNARYKWPFWTNNMSTVHYRYKMPIGINHLTKHSLAPIWQMLWNSYHDGHSYRYWTGQTFSKKNLTHIYQYHSKGIKDLQLYMQISEKTYLLSWWGLNLIYRYCLICFDKNINMLCKFKHTKMLEDFKN